MLGNHGRSITTALFTPLARVLARWHVSPNAVTIAGTIASCAVAIGVVAQGHLLWGGLALALVMFMDSVDGVLARLTGRSSSYGAFLDSSMDRLADGAVFGALLYWAIVGFPDGPVRNVAIVAGIACMTLIGMVPYVRARGESVGVVAKVGIAERTDRLLVAMLAAMATDLGAPLWLYAAALTYVATASAITVAQRMLFVRHRLDELGERGAEASGPLPVSPEASEPEVSE